MTRNRWGALLPGIVIIAVAQLPLVALRLTNADLLALRMAWPIYSVPLTGIGVIALIIGVLYLIFTE